MLKRPFVAPFLLACALAGCSTGMARVPEPADRREAAAGWLLSDVYEAGMRTVTMRKSVGGRDIEHVSHSSANGVRWRTTTFLGDGCYVHRNERLAAGFEELRIEVRQRLEADLAGCVRAPAETAALLAGFDQAFTTFWGWDAQAARWAALSEAALANGPPGPNAAMELRDRD
jgi:hypothetical protein